MKTHKLFDVAMGCLATVFLIQHAVTKEPMGWGLAMVVWASYAIGYFRRALEK